MPVVTVHPLTQDVIAGGVVTLNCTAYGFPGINIDWLKNGVMITQDLIPESSIREERGSLPEDITVTSYLTIEDLQLRDVANYSCNVSNGLVEDRLEYSDNSELTVLCKLINVHVIIYYLYHYYYLYHHHHHHHYYLLLLLLLLLLLSSQVPLSFSLQILLTLMSPQNLSSSIKLNQSTLPALLMGYHLLN